MISTDLAPRAQVLADLATLGTGTSGAVSLLGQARDLATFADQVQGELARLAGIIDASGAYIEAGYTSVAAFLRHACGRSPARAGELLATGRALRRLVATGRALAAGQVSFDAAHVISRTTAQIGDEALAAGAEAQLLAAATAGLPGPSSAADAIAARTGSPPSEPPSPDPDAPAAPDTSDRDGATTGDPAGTATDDRAGTVTDDRAGTVTDDPAGTANSDRAGTAPGDSAAPGDPAAPGAAPAPGLDHPHPADHGDHCDDWRRPGLDPRELRRLGEDLAYRADPDAVEERQRKRFERRYLSFGLTLDEVGTISGACSDALSIEIIKTAADAFSPPGGTGDRRTAAQRRMDGLTAACQAALDSGQAPSRHGAMPHLTVLLEEHFGPGGPADPDPGDHARAPDSPAPGPARTEHGAMLTARQVLTLACRAEISLIRWRDGLPLDVGRRYRTETPALRRALTTRDHGCRFPGCAIPATWCTAHHIRPWQHHGTTRLPNLVLLCFVHHHYFIHLLGWTLTGTPSNELHFTHPNGRLTLDSPLPGQPASRSP
jgi:hypothetical protein